MRFIIDFIMSIIPTIIDFIKEKLNNMTSAPKIEEETIVEDTETLNKDNIVIDADKYASPREVMDTYDYNSVINPIILGNKDAEKTLLIVDDIIQTRLLYRIDFNKIIKLYNKNPYQDFKIVKCLGKQAGYIAYKYVVLEGNKVDIGIIDLTLGHMIKYQDKIIEIDGVDIIYHILQTNPDFRYIMCTAHTLNFNSIIIRKYKEKCINSLNKSISDLYMNKNSDRYKKLLELLYQEEGARILLAESEEENSHGS